jgi:hypothetical protein
MNFRYWGEKSFVFLCSIKWKVHDKMCMFQFEHREFLNASITEFWLVCIYSLMWTLELVSWHFTLRKLSLTVRLLTYVKGLVWISSGVLAVQSAVFLFYFIFSYLGHKKMGQEISLDGKGFIRKKSWVKQVTILAFLWKDWRKSRKTLGRLATYENLQKDFLLMKNLWKASCSTDNFRKASY